MSDDRAVPDEELADVLPGDEAGRRRLTIGVFGVTLFASFVPVVTPLPLGYLLAFGTWLLGVTGVYLFAFRRIQDDFGRELATLRRAIAGVAAAYLLYRVFRTGIRLLSVGPGPSVPEVRPMLIGLALVVGIAAAISVNPDKLVWFVAAMFVLNAVVAAAVGGRLQFGDPAVAFGAYIGLLAVASIFSYILVYHPIGSRLRDRLSQED